MKREMETKKVKHPPKRSLETFLFFTGFLGIFSYLSSAPAIAGTAASSVSISASVAASCTISTTTNVAFGAYDPVGANGASGSDLTANGALSVACVKNTASRIALNQGSNPTGGSTCLAPARQMAAGTERLAFSLYQNVGLTTVWGCDNPGSDMAYTASSKDPVTKTIYGKIPKDQDVGADSYSDSVTATISF